MTLEERLQGICSTYDIFKRAAQAWPGKTALYFLRHIHDNAREITYAQLFRRITQTANLFHALDIGPKDVISTILPNLPQTHYILWGGEATGIVNPINPLLDMEHIIGILNAANSRILVLESSSGSFDMDHIRNSVPGLKHIITLSGGDDESLQYDRIIEQYNGETLDSNRNILSHDICSLFHTGGTTGTPKLARHSHGNEISNAFMAKCVIDISMGDTALCGLPLFHVNAAIITGLSCFLAGSSVFLATPAGYRNKELIPAFWALVEKYRITFFSAVPTIYTALLRMPVQDHDISSLRAAICGAAPIARDVIRKFEASTGLALMEGYGMTEGTCVSCCNPLHGERHVGSVGFRLPYQEMKCVILDGDNNFIRDCKANEIGTIVIRGPNVFKGYLVPSDNEAVWLEGGWFNSGDMGREDEQGYFWLTGRTKELIIRGGHNIDPAIIENALARHDDVEQVAAIGKPDSYAGEVPAAYVVLAPDAKFCEADLISFAADTISERAAIPKNIYLIERMPLTAVGKIFKPALKRDIIRRVIETELADSDIAVNISVAADKTYGTVATIVIEPSRMGTDKIVTEIRQILAQYPFHSVIEINKNIY